MKAKRIANRTNVLLKTLNAILSKYRKLAAV